MATIKGIKVGGTSYNLQAVPTREEMTDPVILEAVDGHEYYLTECTELYICLPETVPHEFWVRLDCKADNEPFIMFMPEISFIGDEPEWLGGFTYEVSVKDGVAVVGRVG